MASDYIQFEGGSFLRSFIASHANEAAFLETANQKGYAHWLEEDPKREEKLKALYAKVGPDVEVKETKAEAKVTKK